MVISFQVIVVPLWTIGPSLNTSGPLSVLNGLPASGSWIFKAVDDAGADTGTIDSWQLQLTVNEPCDAVGMIFGDGFEGGDTSLWSNTAP